MTQEARALLEVFEQLPAEDKQEIAQEILRRSLPIDSGLISDNEIGTASAALFKSLDEEDANSSSR